MTIFEGFRGPPSSCALEPRRYRRTKPAVMSGLNDSSEDEVLTGNGRQPRVNLSRRSDGPANKGKACGSGEGETEMAVRWAGDGVRSSTTTITAVTPEAAILRSLQGYYLPAPLSQKKMAEWQSSV
ncbi:hypothetical protein C2E23DRAFT_620806 [Lenzites betulinus]|nr:hypothetical protein C2E23DRAFT_620806 [Lenzites betulinus]